LFAKSTGNFFMIIFKRSLSLISVSVVDHYPLMMRIRGSYYRRNGKFNSSLFRRSVIFSSTWIVHMSENFDSPRLPPWALRHFGTMSALP
jgi:hypothetical protein